MLQRHSQWTRRLTAPALMGLTVVGFAALLYAELFRQPLATGWGDYQFFHHNWEFGRVAVSRHSELPLWNPYYCGGIPDFGDPQTQVHHPLFFLSFVLGTTLALKLFIVAHAAAGLSGMYLYARRRESLSAPAAALAAVSWVGSGFFAWHCGTGHGGFVAFFLLPWLLLAWREAARDLRYTAGVALVLTLSLLAGGAYVFPYFLLFLAFETLPLLFEAGVRRKVLVAALLSGVLTLLLGAWRLVPVIQHLRLYPRRGLPTDALGLGELVTALTSAAERGPDRVPGHPYSWAEYGMYVGWGVLTLALAGVALAALRDRDKRRLVTGVVIFGSLTLGDFASLAPWNLLKKLPIYGSLQAPSRFSFALLFFLTLLAALALARLTARFATNGVPAIGLRPLGVVWATRAAWFATAALALPVVLAHHRVLGGRWSELPVPRGETLQQFELSFVPDGLRSTALLPPSPQFPAQNRGTGFCYTGMGYSAPTSLAPGAVPQVQVPLGARLLAADRTTRTLWADVELPAGGRLTFNQTHAPGWRSRLGPPVADHGRAALDLPPGRHRVVLRYEPPSLPWAASGSLAGACLALALLSKRGLAVVAGSLRRTLGAAALGTLLAALVYGFGVLARDPEPSSPIRADLTASASDWVERALNDEHKPDKAVDGKPLTEWLAPARPESWLDVRLAQRSNISGLALLNARNAPHDDHSTRQFRVEAYAGTELVGSSKGRFEPAQAGPAWTHVPLQVRQVDRLRIVIERWDGLGGGIAEVRVFF